MISGIPTEWYEFPPRMLIAGNNCFSRALVQVLQAGQIDIDCLQNDPAPLEDGSLPTALDSLERVLLCVDQRASAAETIWQHDRLWRWIEALTHAAEYHEVGYVFIVDEKNAEPIDSALQAEFGLSSGKEQNGIALW